MHSKLVKPQAADQLQYSIASFAALTASGWTEGRRVPIEDWLLPLSAEGYTASTAATEFLSTYGGMVIHLAGNPYSHNLILDPMFYGSGERDRVVEWEQELGLGLFPVGYVSQAYALWISDAGTFFYGIEFGLHSLGASFAEVMNRLLVGDIRETVIAI